MEWHGVIRRAGRLCLYQYVPHCFPVIEWNRGSRGRVITSFTRVKLISIAWKLGVANPDGFDRFDCDFYDISLEEGYKHYVPSWRRVSKEHIINYIWNRLHDMDRILDLS